MKNRLLKLISLSMILTIIASQAVTAYEGDEGIIAEEIEDTIEDTGTITEEEEIISGEEDIETIESDTDIDEFEAEEEIEDSDLTDAENIFCADFSPIVYSMDDEVMEDYAVFASIPDVDISAFDGYDYVLASVNVGDIDGNYRSLSTKYEKNVDPGYDSNIVAYLLSNKDIDITSAYYTWPADTNMAIWLSGSGDMATIPSSYYSGGYYSFWTACFNLSEARYITEMFVDEGITSISAPNLYYLKNIKLPQSLTRINDLAFDGSSSVSFAQNDYRLPDGVTYIGKEAINRGEGGLVTLPSALEHCESDSITWIGYYIVAKTLGGDEIGRYYKSTTYGNPCQFDESTYTYFATVSKELLDTSKIDVSNYVFDHCGVENATLDLKLRPGSSPNEYVFYYSDKNDINITFMQEDGSTQIETLNIRCGDTIIAPNEKTLIVPSKEGKIATFAGWKDVDSKRVYGVSELENALFYSDVTLKAYFTYEDVETLYTVTFKDYDGSIISEENYHYGDIISVPQCTYEYYLDGWNYTFTRWDSPLMKKCTNSIVYSPVYSKEIDTFKVYITDTDGNKYDYINSKDMIFDVSYGQTGAQVGKYFNTLKDITGGSYICPSSFRKANGMSNPSGNAIDKIYSKWTKSYDNYNPLKQYRLTGYTSSADGFIPLDKLMSHIFKEEQTLTPVFDEVNYTTGHYAKVYSTYMSSMNWDGVVLSDDELLVTWYMGDDDYVILPLGNNGLNITDSKYGNSYDPGSYFYRATNTIYGGCSNTYLENVMIVGNISDWGPTRSDDYYITGRYTSSGPTVYENYNLNLNYTTTNLDSNNDFRSVENGHAYFPDGPQDYEINLPEYPSIEEFNDNYGVHYTNQNKWIISESYGLFEPFFADMNAASVIIDTSKWDEAISHSFSHSNANINLQIQVRPYFIEAPREYSVNLYGKDGSIVLSKKYKHFDKLILPTLTATNDKFYTYSPLYWYNMNDISDIYFMDDEITIRKDLNLCMKYSAMPKDIVNNFKVTLPLSLSLAKDADNMLRTSFDIGLSYEASMDETYIEVATPDFILTSNKGAKAPVNIKGRDKTKWYRNELDYVSGNRYKGTQHVTLECDPKDMTVGEYEGTLKFIITTGISD